MRTEQQELLITAADMTRLKAKADQKIEAIIRKQYATAMENNNQHGITQAKQQADLMGIKLS